MLSWFQPRSSIYEHIKRHINRSGPGLLPGGETLPDEPDLSRAKTADLAPGAMDGALGPGDIDSLRVERLLLGLMQAGRESGSSARRRLEQLLSTDDCLTHVDVLGQRLAEQPVVNWKRLHEHARRIFLATDQRGTLKYATAILGWTGKIEDLELLRTVGRHEEFTLYAAVAMANMLEDPIEEWLALADNVKGWGKIQLVRHIAEELADTEQPHVRYWLLRHGCENSVLDEYLAATVASAGRLHEALAGPEPDDELLRGAGIILAAMIAEWPVPGFSAYPEGEQAASLYLGHMANRASTLAAFPPIHRLDQFLQSGDCRWQSQATLHQQAAAILAMPHWPGLALLHVQDDDRTQAALAWSVARALRLDITGELTQLLMVDPVNERVWLELVTEASRATMATAVNLAQQLLPLGEILTGPGWPGVVHLEAPVHRCLETVIQELRRFPGLGSALLAQALQSPVSRTRHLALQSLAAWPGDAVTPELQAAVQACRDQDPDRSIAPTATETQAHWAH